jgi:ABC-type multidrug transport system ATPase subunit
MYAYLTVFETLMLSAHFFLPTELSNEEKTAIVDDTISELGLMKAKETIIGNDKIRGVSGGERKRTSIAVQLLSDPAVLFLDEPTSGLDAFQSQAVMESLKTLSSHNRLVITVIHQPRSSIYEMFDRLLILSEGKVMYMGPASEAVNYFSEAGHICPDNFNPSDFFLDLLSPDHRSKEADEMTSNRINHLGHTWLTYTNSLSMKGGKDAKTLSLYNIDTAETEEAEKHFKSVKVIGSGFSLQKTIRNTGTNPVFFVFAFRLFLPPSLSFVSASPSPSPFCRFIVLEKFYSASS